MEITAKELKNGMLVNQSILVGHLIQKGIIDKKDIFDVDTSKEIYSWYFLSSAEYYELFFLRKLKEKNIPHIVSPLGTWIGCDIWDEGISSCFFEKMAECFNN
jgi:hypothetical protein